MDSLFGRNLTLLSKREASTWASEFTRQKITQSNIERLIRFNHLELFKNNGNVFVEKGELEAYYSSRNFKREMLYKDKLGENLHWHLSFDGYKERETTKHVHRLHPYKGKYIPQLVEYLLDSSTDEFKIDSCFKKGDIILDPFCGSGTTLVQANEMGMHGIGIDVSEFNCAITNAKLTLVSLSKLSELVDQIESAIQLSEVSIRARTIERVLGDELSRLNSTFFDPRTFRARVRDKEVNDCEYAKQHVEQYTAFFKDKTANLFTSINLTSSNQPFLSKWFLPTVLAEILIAKEIVEKLDNSPEVSLVKIILSRTVRSARATKHDDLATLTNPCDGPYYCRKHYKICKPVLSMLRWWRRYAKDTMSRVAEFEELRSDARHACLEGDSRSIPITEELAKACPELATELTKNQVAGIITSPPYVGIIDYHEQHAYAYELFHLVRRDELEIGPLYSGSGAKAKEQYGRSIARVFQNCLTVMKPKCNIFVVVNDKFDLYPEIIKASNLEIRNRFERPVLNRAEGNKGFYSESIFHLTKRSL